LPYVLGDLAVLPGLPEQLVEILARVRLDVRDHVAQRGRLHLAVSVSADLERRPRRRAEIPIARPVDEHLAGHLDPHGSVDQLDRRDPLPRPLGGMEVRPVEHVHAVVLEDLIEDDLGRFVVPVRTERGPVLDQSLVILAGQALDDPVLGVVELGGVDAAMIDQPGDVGHHPGRERSAAVRVPLDEQRLGAVLRGRQRRRHPRHAAPDHHDVVVHLHRRILLYAI